MPFLDARRIGRADLTSFNQRSRYR